MTTAIAPVDHESGQSRIAETFIVSPYNAAWWEAQTITDIPQESVGWLVAQGWRITAVTYDTSRVPNTPRYTMARQSLNNWRILEDLLTSYETAHNTALTNNATRYNDIVLSWDQMADNSEDYFDTQATEQNEHVSVFLADLNTYMNDVDAEIDKLESDYIDHEGVTPALLDGLGTTELARINEKFAASLATQLQDLTDRGLYSAAVAADITARNTRDANEEIATLNDRLNREKVEDEHRVYGQQAAMRTSVISSKMNESAARLAGLQQQHADNMALMKYFLDERNKLLVGLYGFVERREDAYPSFENLVQIATGLGDAGGGWVTP